MKGKLLLPGALIRGKYGFNYNVNHRPNEALIIKAALLLNVILNEKPTDEFLLAFSVSQQTN